MKFKYILSTSVIINNCFALIILPRSAAVISLSITPFNPFSWPSSKLYAGIPPPPPAITIVPKFTKCLIDMVSGDSLEINL